MAIYSEPAPLNGVFHYFNKSDIERLYCYILVTDKDFAEHHQISVDQYGYLPSGMSIDKLRKSVQEIWPIIPVLAKEAFLRGQYNAAVEYLNECIAVCEQNGVSYGSK